MPRQRVALEERERLGRLAANREPRGRRAAASRDRWRRRQRPIGARAQHLPALGGERAEPLANDIASAGGTFDLAARDNQKAVVDRRSTIGRADGNRRFSSIAEIDPSSEDSNAKMGWAPSRHSIAIACEPPPPPARAPPDPGAWPPRVESPADFPRRAGPASRRATNRARARGDEGGAGPRRRRAAAARATAARGRRAARAQASSRREPPAGS